METIFTTIGGVLLFLIVCNLLFGNTVDKIVTYYRGSNANH